MVLIADSGSTKCDWVLHDVDRVVLRIETKGLNPNILSYKQLNKVLAKNEELLKIKDLVKSVYFFGAGCGTAINQQVLTRVLRSNFETSTVLVQEDLMAAVWAINKTPALICILGTGSNCCYFNGKSLVSKVPSLGYLLMDEGSGNGLGKRLLRAYYYGQMPHEIEDQFKEQFNLSPEHVVQKLYNSKTPNRYLATYARFAIDQIDHPFIAAQIRDEINLFIERHLLIYDKELINSNIYFIGSIAYFTQQLIKKELDRRGYQLTGVIKRPLEQIIANLNNDKLKITAEQIGDFQV